MRFTYTVTTAAALAVASLRAHKLRSFLTLLGVIIGVSSVVIVGAAIEGLGTYAEETTSKVFGSDGYQIGQLLQVGRLSRRERIEKLKYNHQIRPDDYAYLRQTTGSQILYSPYRLRAEDIHFESRLLESTSIIGVSANLAEIREVDLTDGRFFTEQEEHNEVPVAVIGEDVRTEFFPRPLTPRQDHPHQWLRIRLGIGVQEKIGSAGGQSQDNVALIPSTVFNRLYGPEKTMLLFARARPETGLTLEQALDLSRVALRTRFKARPGKPDNFDTITPDSIREFIGRIMGLIGAVVVPITCISLVVGGIRCCSDSYRVFPYLT
ncbi:MAG: ABC transporter permease, partial [Paludibaculum sp.]